jgi:TonB family protein
MEATGVSSGVSAEQTAAQTPDFGPQMPLAEKLLAIAIRAQNFTGASGVAVAIREGDEVVCRASWGTSAPDVGVRLQDQNSFTYQCLRAGVPMRCDDASSDPRVDAAACATLGISSIAAAPVAHGDGVLGVIAAFSEQANAFTETHMVVLTTLGEVVAKFLKDELPAPASVAAGEPLAPTSESAAIKEEEPLQEIAPELPSLAVSAPQLPVQAEARAEASVAVPAIPVLSSILASARSKLPAGAVEKTLEVSSEQMRPRPEMAPAPGLLASAEQVSAPQKPQGGKLSTKPGALTLPSQEIPNFAAPHFGTAPGFDWHGVLHRKFLIPVGAAAVLVFALVTWTFHSFRSRQPVPPPASAPVEQPADSSAAQAPEPAELTSSVPTTSTVLEVSAKPTAEKRPAPVRKEKENLQKTAATTAEPEPVVDTTNLVRQPNAIPVTQHKAEAAPAPSLSLLDAPPQLPVLKSATPPSTVVGPSVSHVVSSKLLHSSSPAYPETARRFHMTGKVVLSARIGADGKVKSVVVVSGPAVFQNSAMEAVKSWRYRPATLDGQPIESTAEITLNFAAPR